MIVNIHKLIDLIRALIRRYFDHRVDRSASALAYSFLFALFPMLLVVDGLLGRYRDALILALQKLPLIPGDARAIALSVLSAAPHDQNAGYILWGLGLALYFTAMAVGVLLDALDEATGRKARRGFWSKSLLGLLFAGGVLTEILIMLLLPGLGGLLWDQALIHFPGLTSYEFLWTVLRFGLAAAPGALLLLLLYWVSGETRRPLKSSLPGALLAVVCWMAVSFAFSLYMSYFSRYTTLYGAVGGVLVLMLWFFLTANIFILGGELNTLLWDNRRL